MRRSDLSADEQTNVRTALKFLRARCGSLKALGKVLGIDHHCVGEVIHGRNAVSARMAFRVARLAQVGVDDVLSGRFPDPKACPYCGHCPAPEVSE